MAKKDKPKYTVIRDTREKPGQGWKFQPSSTCEGTVIETLETADYTLKGYEKLFLIERKANTSELATNVVDPRFRREMERLSQFEHPFIICEFTQQDVDQFPIGSGIPANKWKSLRISPQFLLSCIVAIQVTYRIPIYMAGKSGAAVASSLFKRIVERCPLIAQS